MAVSTLRILSMLCVLLSFVGACSSPGLDDVNLVVSKVNMRALAQGENTAVVTFGTGRLSDGGAVLWVEKDAAFWVKDGTVYTVNDNAKTLAPDLPTSPDEITYQAVYDVVDEKPIK